LGLAQTQYRCINPQYPTSHNISSLRYVFHSVTLIPNITLITAAACFPSTPTTDLFLLSPKEPHFLHLLNYFYLSVRTKTTPKTIFFPNYRLQKLHVWSHLSYFHEFSTGSERLYCQPLRESSSVIAKGKCNNLILFSSVYRSPNPYFFYMNLFYFQKKYLCISYDFTIFFFGSDFTKFSNLTNYLLMKLF
jgi:hypothetical protein